MKKWGQVTHGKLLTNLKLSMQCYKCNGTRIIRNCPNIPQLSCPISHMHWRFCPDTCQKKFVPVALPHPGGNGNVIYVSNFPHEKNCNKRVTKTLTNLLGNCPGQYYSCAGVDSCTNANNHINGTKPSPPASVSLTAGSISIEVNWTNPTSDGGESITRYEYQYRSLKNRRSWNWSGWSSAGKGNTYIITGLSPNTIYQIRMRAINKVGASRATDTVSVRTQKTSMEWER